MKNLFIERKAIETNIFSIIYRYLDRASRYKDSIMFKTIMNGPMTYIFSWKCARVSSKNHVLYFSENRVYYCLEFGIDQ